MPSHVAQFLQAWTSNHDLEAHSTPGEIVSLPTNKPRSALIQLDFLANVPSGHKHAQANSFLGFQTNRKISPTSFGDATESAKDTMNDCFKQKECKAAVMAEKGGPEGKAAFEAMDGAETKRKEAKDKLDEANKEAETQEADALEKWKSSGIVNEGKPGKFAFAGDKPCFISSVPFRTYCESTGGKNFKCKKADGVNMCTSEEKN